jgi:hypothetical protein
MGIGRDQGKSQGVVKRLAPLTAWVMPLKMKDRDYLESQRVFVLSSLFQITQVFYLLPSLTHGFY